MRRARSLFPIALALGLTGCGAGGQFEHDPLTGGPPLRGRPAPAAGAVSRNNGGSPLAPAYPPGQVPPPPPPYSTTSAAALAGSTSRNGGDNPLRESDPGQRSDGRVAPVAVAGPPQGTPPAAPTPGNSLTLAGGPPRGEPTYEQVQAMLTARGVTMQHLQTVGERGEWKFSCAVPNRQAPDLRRVYQATASGASGLAAMKAVLDEIDRTQGYTP